MIASLLISILTVPALLLLLLNVAATQGYTGRVPGGSDAMGLALPFFLSIIGSIALLLAAWICAARGGLSWIGPAGVAAAAATAVSIGVGLAATGVLIAWMERMGSWVVPVGLFCGAFGPLCLGAVLLAGAWAAPATLASSVVPRIAGAALVLVALCGYGMGLFGAWKYMVRSSENARRVLEAHQADEQEWARQRERSPMEALREDYAKMSDQAPLWVFIASLPDRHEPECREFIIARALKVPDFDAQLASTLADGHPRYRHGCLDLIRFGPAAALKPDWATVVTDAIRSTAAQIKADPSWLDPDEFANPDPVEHIRASVEAAARLGNPGEALAALAELKTAIAGCAPSTERDSALAAMRDVGG
jgi:hypothetical protein